MKPIILFLSQTLFIGKQHLQLEEVDSTNAYLQAYSESRMLPEGTVVSTKYQTKGRGQRGTEWQSEPGNNLLLSLLLYPRFLKVEQQFLLSQVVALAVMQAVNDKLGTPQALIKWPNDILVGGNKICGILIENSLQGSYLKSSIVGIGLNVNDYCKGLPKATSLMLAGGRSYDIRQVEERLFSTLESRYLQLRQGQYSRIREDYLNHLYGFGQELCFRDQLRDEIVFGQISGVSTEGKLQLQTSVRMLEFGLKEISFL